jgi:hypothetical protein
VALATIVLVLTEPVPPKPEPALELTQTVYPGHDGGSGCPGIDQVTVDEGDEVTVCFEAANTGDTLLADVEVMDQGLDADFDDLFVVDGDPEAPLPPEERLLFAFEAVAEPYGYVAPAVTATAVDGDGDPLRKKVEIEVESIDLRVVEDDSLPGFGDALGAAWRALQRLWGAIVVLAGAVLPFLWIPVLVLGFWWLGRRRSSRNEHPPVPPSDEPTGPEGSPEED